MSGPFLSGSQSCSSQSPAGQGIGSLKLFYALSCLVLQDYKIKGLASLSKLFYMPKSFSFFFL